ncbi:probable protein phosphatase 2C 12 [Chenopodium quinoa]|uniref:probable protein phosphatase 2C 12 n=1 Tax=Chenopodium quinoa TaxID=63459 RepID=UPI000B790580|nr:probable protein phosphatase 2C 12 [Chenopodium quinoa]
MGGTTSSPVLPEGLGSVAYDQNSMKRNQQIKYGSVHTQQGGKGVNQDSAVLCQGYGSRDGVFCGVFDGHGKTGHHASKAIKYRLPLLLLDQKNAVLSSEANANNLETQSSTNSSDSSPNIELLKWKEACINAFDAMDEVLKSVKKFDYSFSGSTAVVALKQGDDLLVANLGDSRAILGTRGENGVTAVQLTTDLKPGNTEEANRIRRFKGRVFALRDEPSLQRAWMPHAQSPGMAMSRSFGDLVMKHYGIICTPVFTHHHITSDDLFIVLATDGVWDVLGIDEVTSAVCSVDDEKMAAKAVVDAAVAAWKKKIPHDKRDDCTAVCYFLQKKNRSGTSSPTS